MIIDPYTWRELEIKHIAAITSDTLSVRVARPRNYTYRAGQYAVLRATIDGTPVLRQYSFASCPDNDFLEFLVQREPDGVVSNWFHAVASAGTRIEVSQPFGSFVIESPQQPVLCIAGRVGIAPFISIIRDALAHDGTHNISLLYSARGSGEFCYPELCEAVGATFFDTQNGERIDDATLSSCLQPSTRAYLSGSKQFVDSLAERLFALGLPRDQLKRELFTLQ